MTRPQFQTLVSLNRSAAKFLCAGKSASNQTTGSKPTLYGAADNAVMSRMCKQYLYLQSQYKKNLMTNLMLYLFLLFLYLLILRHMLLNANVVFAGHVDYGEKKFKVAQSSDVEAKKCKWLTEFRGRHAEAQFSLRTFTVTHQVPSGGQGASNWRPEG